MKKQRLLLLPALLAAALLWALPALADNHVSNMEIDMQLQKDGAAVITQVWQGTFDEGTECYIPIQKSGYLTITDVSAADENGTYQTVSAWDVSDSLEEKARRCGLIDNGDGYELCWGISAYGEHRYTVSYTVHDVLGAYEDADGFLFRFVNDQLSVTPTDAILRIYAADGTALTDDNADIWAFGYEGQIVFDAGSGAIVAKTEEPLTKRNHMTIMVALEKGLFSPARTVSGSFESVKEKAFENSDYEEYDGRGFMIGMLVFFFVIVAAVVAIIVASIKRKKRFRAFSEQAGYFTDIPNGGNLLVTARLAREYNLCDAYGDGLVSALLLRLLNSGCITLAEDDSSRTASRKNNMELRLLHSPAEEQTLEAQLYRVFFAEADSDGVLREKQLKKLYKTTTSGLEQFIKNCTESGEALLKAQGYFLGERISADVRKLTEHGAQALSEITGLKRYLEECSTLAGADTMDYDIWRDYLIYAVLFGISDKVLEQLKKLFPKLPEPLAPYVYYAGYTTRYSAQIQRTRTAAQSARGGSGGSSSFGGGGGFSGGGSGGGCR